MKFLKYELEIRWYTQKNLADFLKVRPNTVSDWINGKTSRIKKAWLERIAKFLNISYDKLIEMRRKEYE